MYFMKSIVPTAMLVCTCASNHLLASAQPTGTDAQARAVTVDSTMIGEDRPSMSTEHIYSWDAVPEYHIRDIMDKGASTEAASSLMGSLVNPRSHGGLDGAKRESGDKRGEKAGGGRPRRLRFDSRKGNPAGVKWGYGDVQGRWVAIKKDEYGVADYPNYN